VTLGMLTIGAKGGRYIRVVYVFGLEGVGRRKKGELGSVIPFDVR
jgi:hypothetical protein